MPDGSELALIAAIEAQPVELERRLSTTMRGIGRRITERPEIVRAMAAAEMVKDGYVIAEEAQAIEVADLVAQVIDGEKALTEQVRLAVRIPKQMETALKESVEQVKDRLAAARMTGNTARVTWQATLRRRAAEEEARRRQEAERAAREAAALAEQMGDDDAPPVAEMGPVEVPRTVSGGTGKMGTMVTISAIEVVSWEMCPRGWLMLVPARAREAFLAAGMKVHVKPGENIVWKGVKFEAVESAVNRR